VRSVCIWCGVEPAPLTPIVSPKVTTAVINERLRSLCHTLGKNSLNYTVDIHLYPAPGRVGESLEQTVAAALGHRVVVGGAESASFSMVVESLRTAIDYSGDDGSYPNREFLSSAEFRTEKERVVDACTDLLAGADRVVSFWLKEGHPFYPVFWDFAYMLEKGDEAYVFIGSSSD
jgi:hypothetical protein